MRWHEEIYKKIVQENFGINIIIPKKKKSTLDLVNPCKIQLNKSIYTPDIIKIYKNMITK